MLEIRPICENCGKELTNTSNEAMICTFECTFCKDCVDTILFNVCPNCGGGFEKRPIRPASLLEKQPVSKCEYLNPVDPDKFQLMLDKFKGIDPDKR